MMKIQNVFANSFKGKTIVNYYDGTMTVICHNHEGSVIGNKRSFKRSVNINDTDSFSIESMEDNQGWY